MNTCVLAGNLGNDPESYFSSEGVHIVSFNMAFRSAGKDKTGWIKVTCFNKLAEIAEKYLHKGARIVCEGVLDHDKWEKNGETRSAHKIVANQITFVKTDGRGFEKKDGDLEPPAQGE
jgi:single-strand DNA-binding protein